MKDKFLTPEDKFRLEQKFDVKAKALGHEIRNVGTGMIDQTKCTCGWLGAPYMDGVDLARSEWVRHIESVCADGQLSFQLD